MEMRNTFVQEGQEMAKKLILMNQPCQKYGRRIKTF